MQTLPISRVIGTALVAVLLVTCLWSDVRRPAEDPQAILMQKKLHHAHSMLDLPGRNPVRTNARLPVQNTHANRLMRALSL